MSARTEILRYMLSRRATVHSAASLAMATGYAKRIVAEECEALVRAGVLSTVTLGTMFMYRLTRRDELASLLGDLPPDRPDWQVVGTVVATLVQAERDALTSTARLVPVAASHALDSLVPALGQLDHEVDIPDVPDQLWTALESAAATTLGEWAHGRWTASLFQHERPGPAMRPVSPGGSAP